MRNQNTYYNSGNEVWMTGINRDISATFIENKWNDGKIKSSYKVIIAKSTHWLSASSSNYGSKSRVPLPLSLAGHDCLGLPNHGR